MDFRGISNSFLFDEIIRGGSRAAATSQMERFVIIVNDFQPLTIITKRSNLILTAALDPPFASLNITRLG